MRRTLTQLYLLLAFPALAFGTERFPPPEFTNHQYPPETYPVPRAEWLGYLDIAVLLVALGAAAYLVLKKRSRRGIFALTVLSVLYFGFYRKGCVCSVGSIQNVALSIWQHDYALPLTVAAFFLLPLIFALFFGRVFCAAVCPLGAVQDLVLLRPVKVPSWLQHALGLLPYIYLGAAVLFAATGGAFLVCQYDPFVSFFRLGGSTFMLSLGVAMLLLAVFVGRPYCRFLCPYGVLLRWLSPLARWRVSISPGECVHCHLCEDACPYGAIRKPTPETATGQRYEGKGRLALLILLLPLLVALGGWLGYRGSTVLARTNPTVSMATRLLQEERHQVKGTTEPTDAFRKLGVPTTTAYRKARTLVAHYATGGSVLGGWIGLILGLKLILLSIRRRRGEYDADPGECVACGRCYRYCPVEHAHQQKPDVKITVLP